MNNIKGARTQIWQSNQVSLFVFTAETIPNQCVYICGNLSRVVSSDLNQTLDQNIYNIGVFPLKIQ